MPRTSTIVALLLFLSSVPLLSYSQVDAIKRAASSAGSAVIKSEGSSSSLQGSGVFVNLIFNLAFSEVVYAQQRRLEQKQNVPSTVSLDIMFQSAVQPSSYYILNPRIRGNWGLFSTDFRLNYLLEEDIDGVKHIRTDDWQILELNLVATRNATFRIGGGVMREAFGEERSYGEWTAALQIHPFNSRYGGGAEYRDAEVRKEVSGYMQYHLFDRGIVHGFATAGAAFQRYYDKINVWGMQGGLNLKLY